MKNDKGFSLIELIVVIAIMTVLTVGTVMGMSSVFQMEYHTVAKNIVANLNYTQTAAMAKSLAYLTLTSEKDAYYITVTEGKDDKQKTTRKKLCSRKNEIYYTTSQKPEPQELKEGESLCLSYRKTSGASLPMILSVSEDGQFSFASYNDADGTTQDVYCTGIEVKREEKTKKITIYPKTGKCQIEE